MHTKRIIPCLDVNKGRVVKGVNFVNLQDAGDPVEIAAAYDRAGADELVFLDITASSDARSIVVDMVRRVAETVFIPFTVGGGIRTVEDFRAILREGADKVSINSSAIDHPRLISDAAEKFGSQCVVVAIDARRREDGSGWNIFKNGGRVEIGETHLTVRRIAAEAWHAIDHEQRIIVVATNREFRFRSRGGVAAAAHHSETRNGTGQSLVDVHSRDLNEVITGDHLHRGCERTLLGRAISDHHHLLKVGSGGLHHNIL